MLGEVIAQGAQSEIREYGPGRVVKLFRPSFAYIAETEFERTRAVHAAGLPCPEVYEFLEIDGRPAIVLERVDGRTMPGPEDLARLHVEMHAAPPPELPHWREVVPRVRATLPEADVETFDARIARLPDGRSVYHGDFHPNNVIRSERGLVVVDWPNAMLAHAAADVARSVILIRYQGVLFGDEKGTRRRAYADAYLAEYMRAGAITRAELDACLAYHAAGLLRFEPHNVFAAELRCLAEGIPVDGVVLHDEGIRLRPMHLGDADEWMAGEDDEQIRWFEFPGPAQRANVVAAIERWAESWRTNGPVRHWAVCDAESGAILGGVEIRDLGDQAVNLSYVVFPAARRHGVATRAARLALAYAASELNARAVLIKVLQGNDASLGVARRLGAVETGTEPSEAGGTFRVYRRELPDLA